MAIAWQLRGLRGNYGMHMAVTGSTWQPSTQRPIDRVLQELHRFHNRHVDPRTVTRWSIPTPFCDFFFFLAWLLRDDLCQGETMV